MPQSAPSLAADSAAPPAPRSMAIVIPMAGLMFLVIADHLIMLPLMPEICESFHQPTSWVPVLVGSYSFATFFSAFFWGPWSDRLGRARLIRIFAIGFTLTNLLCGLSTNLWMLLGARLATGLFGGPLGATMNAYVGDLFDGDRRTKAIGYLSMGFPVAVIVAVPAGAVVGGAYGWQMVPYALAVLGVICTTLVMRFPHVAVEQRPRGLLAEYGEMIRVVFNRRGLPFFLTVFLIMATFFGYVANISVWLVSNQGMDVTANHHLAIMYTVGGVGSILGALAFRLMIKLVGRTELLFGSALLSGGLVYVLVSREPNTPLYVLCLLFFCSQFSGSLRRPLAGLIAVDIAPPWLRGRYMAMLNITISLAFAVAAAWTKLVLDYPTFPANPNGTRLLVGMDHVALWIVAGTLAAVPSLALVRREINHVRDCQKRGEDPWALGSQPAPPPLLPDPANDGEPARAGWDKHSADG